MAIVTPQCIHGFPSEQCVSCRNCEHGHQFSSCSKCRTPIALRRVPEPTGDLTAHEHAGFEIFFDPAVSGWRYRAADATASRLSYRSAFLARKAVSERVAAGPEAEAVTARKRRKG
jgi:hypothetical protein